MQALSKRKDFELMKKEALSFSCEWLKAFFLYQNKESLKTAWSLPKKHIPSSVARNRLKRWGRENLRKTSMRGLFLFVFLERELSFYSQLKRKDFDNVFKRLMEQVSKNSQ